MPAPSRWQRMSPAKKRRITMQEPPWMPRTEEEYRQQLAEDAGPQPDEMVRLQMDLDAAQAALAQVAAERDAARRGVERLTAENDQIRSVVYEMVQPTINSMGESWLFDPRHEDDDRASLTTSFGALRRARQVFPSGMFRYQNPALHPFVPLSGSQDTGGRYTRCSVVGCTVPPEGHPK